MLFYSYCPECGCESDPFRIEPEDGTPMKCPRCGLEYPYKTRHWMAQRISLRIFLLLVVLFVLIRGCFDDGRTKERRKPLRAEEQTIAIDYTCFDVRKGFGQGFEWGSKWEVCNGERKLKLADGCGWSGVKFFYGKNGLESFVLTADVVTAHSGMEIVEQTFRAMRRSIKFATVKEYRNGDRIACVYLPDDEFAVVLERDEEAHGQINAIRLKITNAKVAGNVINYAGTLKKRGWVEED